LFPNWLLDLGSNQGPTSVAAIQSSSIESPLWVVVAGVLLGRGEQRPVLGLRARPGRSDHQWSRPQVAKVGNPWRQGSPNT